MATFKNQITGYVKATIPATDAEISQFLTDGAADIINRFAEVDKTLAADFGTVTSVDSSGAMVEGEIIEAWASDGDHEHSATRLSAGNARHAEDVNSLHYRSKYSPYWYKEGKLVYIKPNGGNVLHLTYPEVKYDSESVYNFPKKYHFLIVLYGAIKCLYSRSTNLNSS